MVLELTVGRGWKNFEEHDRQSLDYLEWTVKIWMLKALLVRAQKEMRNLLLEGGGKRIFVIEWQKA